MGAITGTKVALTEFAGQQRLLLITASIGAASDTITLTEATHGVAEIVGIIGAVITGGMDADFSEIQVSFSGLVITVVSKQPDGAAADEFTGTTIALTLLVK